MITYVTGNIGKYYSVKDHFEKFGLDCSFLKYDLEELEVNDITQISHQKAISAFELTGTPTFVIDSGFYIEDYPGCPGYPGAFAKRSHVTSDIESLLETMKDVKNRNCEFVDCLTFYDGINFYTFYSTSKGVLSTTIRGDNTKKAKSNLWKVFIPEGYDKTLAEFTDEEHAERKSHTPSATVNFIKWYKEVYLKSPALRKK